MSESFDRITHSLRRDTGLGSFLSLIVSFLFISAWGIWAFRAQITRYEVSDSARLEVNASAYPVQSPLSERVASSSLALGRQVREGDVLVELDAGAARLNLDEERARYAGIEPQLATLKAQIASEQAGAEADRRVLTYSDTAALASYRQADAEAALAEEQAARDRKMLAEGILAPAEAAKTAANAQSKRAAADGLKAALSRLQPELAVKDREREVRIKQIAAQEAKLEADLSVSGATIKRLENEIDRRKIRAPISGQLAECATLVTGAHVSEGQQLGVILPSSGVRIVAQFQPVAALGKIHPGQTATVRLDGFPWAQFGVVTARVTRVASEIRDGKVRVELAVTHKPNIPMQHGQPGLVEVEIERLSPAAMLLRSAGTLAGAR
ncbi:MAG: HlyD family efflux transporter periplasmic adaptor subunit [Acidobacteriaceae bacterium]|nr:HlyD family efflux transporter periplasmic adaptor subunit [Acidobacteriaceae bacterium]